MHHAILRAKLWVAAEGRCAAAARVARHAENAGAIVSGIICKIQVPPSLASLPVHPASVHEDFPPSFHFLQVALYHGEDDHQHWRNPSRTFSRSAYLYLYLYLSCVQSFDL